MTLKNNRAPLLSNTKLCASFHHHMWIQNGVTVRKRLSWVLTSVTLTFDLWPWPFAWTSLLSLVITAENFMMRGLWEHSEKGVTDRQTDRRTDWTIHRAAWSQLKRLMDGRTDGRTNRRWMVQHRTSYADYVSSRAKNVISYTGKTVSLYWIRAQVAFWQGPSKQTM